MIAFVLICVTLIVLVSIRVTIFLWVLDHHGCPCHPRLLYITTGEDENAGVLL